MCRQALDELLGRISTLTQSLSLCLKLANESFSNFEPSVHLAVYCRCIMTQSLQNSPPLVWLITGESLSVASITSSLLLFPSPNPSCCRQSLTGLKRILGGSSGLGLSLVKRVLARGDFVIAPVRDPRKLFSQLPVDDKTSVQASPPLTDRLHVFQFDMADSLEVMKGKVNESVNVWGRIDVLVNNAAQLMLGTLEEGGYVPLIC